MKSTNPNTKTTKSIFKDLAWGIIALFLGDASSKIGLACLSFFGGIAVLLCPVVDNGIVIKKSVLAYVIGSGLIVLALGIIISQAGKNKRKR